MTDKQNQRLLLIVYSFLIGFICVFFLWLGNFKIFQDFVIKIEQNSFDMRQAIASKYKIMDERIVVLAIDDAAYEYIMDTYGVWPVSRKVWADIVELLELADPKAIVFDLLFIIFSIPAGTGNHI